MQATQTMSTQGTLVDNSGGDTTDPPAAERHPRLYSLEVDDGFKIIRASVENTLFRFHFAILYSFSQLFVPPKNLGSVVEGATDEDPIYFYGDSAMHWGGLLGWASFINLVPSDIDWIGILILSKKYVSVTGVDHALFHLADAKSIHSTYGLRLALQFHLPRLVQTGVEALLKPPFTVLTAQDLRDLEPELAAIINNYRNKINVQRMTLVCHLAAFIHSFQCDRKEDCESQWAIAYRSCTRQLANPTSTATGREILARFGREIIPGMDPDCFRYTMDSLVGTQGFWKEERFVAEAVEAVKELVQDENRLTTFPLRIYNPGM